MDSSDYSLDIEGDTNNSLISIYMQVKQQSEPLLITFKEFMQKMTHEQESCACLWFHIKWI